jgi:hypothetical protein
MGTQSLRSTGAAFVVATRIAGLPEQLNSAPSQKKRSKLRQLISSS